MAAGNTYTLPAAYAGTPKPAAKPVSKKEPEAGIGQSVAGLIAASMVGAACCVVWIIVALVTSRELGILAWGMGGLIGLVAGFIAKSKSPIYCGLAAGIAMISILSAKFIMALGLMMLSMGVDMVRDFGDFSPERERKVHVLADHMLADGQLDENDKQFALDYNRDFFGDERNGRGRFNPRDDDEGLDADFGNDRFNAKRVKDNMAFLKKLRDQVETVTPEEIAQWTAESRTRHPNWIENQDHFIPMLDEMLLEPESLTPELGAHAKQHLSGVDGKYDDAYSSNIAPNEFQNRDAQIKRLVATRIRKKSPEELDQAMRKSIVLHDSYDPFPDAYIAMLESVNAKGGLDGAVASHAKKFLDATLSGNDSDRFDIDDYEAADKLDKALRKSVCPELAKLGPSERDALVADLRKRHPKFVGHDPEAMSKAANEALGKLGGHSTLFGAMKEVFHPLDFLWLFLGASTAFGTARRFAPTT
jgi:hypothetical protein